MLSAQSDPYRHPAIAREPERGDRTSQELQSNERWLCQWPQTLQN